MSEKLTFSIYGNYVLQKNKMIKLLINIRRISYDKGNVNFVKI